MKKKLLLGIVFLAALLRLYRLGSVPTGLSWDEASLAYNAWSISLTGRDEHGRFLPYDSFVAFGDYKPPAYVYAAVPFVKILGPTPLAVRLPSAIAGVLAVYFTYLLTKHLFLLAGDRLAKKADKIGLVASFFLAISPWHLQMSRTAVEANLSSTLIIIGASLLMLSLRRSWLLPLAAIFMVLSLYAFNSARVFTPLLLVGIGLIFWHSWLKETRWLLAAAVAGLVLIAPLIPFLRSPQSRLRFHEVNIFSDLNVVQTANQRIELDRGVLPARLIHNRRLGYLRHFLDHYFDHFSGEFLLARGDENPKLSVTKMGELYLLELPFLLAGLYLLLKERSRAAWLLFWWLVVAPIPAATARETPHALRTLVFLPSFSILSAVGLTSLWTRHKKLVLAALVLVLVQVGLYLDYYYRFYPVEFSKDWLYAYQPLVREVLDRENDFDQIYITDAYGRPYIFFLLYGRVRPEIFWQEGVVESDVFGFKNVTRFGKYQFGQFDYQKQTGTKSLFVGKLEEFPAGVVPTKVINHLNGQPAFWLVET